MMSRLKFSIVITVYNNINLLPKALDSCLAQEYPAFEIIVVDDASTQWNETILNPYQDKIKLIRSKTNQGVSAARNLGAVQAQGDYLAFLDVDDFWLPQKLKQMAVLIEQYPNHILWAHAFTYEGFSNDVAHSTIKKLSFFNLLVRNKIQGSSMVMMRSKHFEFNPSLRYSEDYDLALRVAYAKPILFYTEPLTILGRKPLSEGGLSANLWAMRLGEMKAFCALPKLHVAFYLLVPLLLLYSLLKFVLLKLLKA